MLTLERDAMGVHHRFAYQAKAQFATQSDEPGYNADVRHLLRIFPARG